MEPNSAFSYTCAKLLHSWISDGIGAERRGVYMVIVSRLLSLPCRCQVGQAGRLGHCRWQPRQTEQRQDCILVAAAGHRLEVVGPSRPYRHSRLMPSTRQGQRWPEPEAAKPTRTKGKNGSPLAEGSGAASPEGSGDNEDSMLVGESRGGGGVKWISTEQTAL
nr:unnamed protein product [Digitaria exilis]